APGLRARAGESVSAAWCAGNPCCAASSGSAVVEMSAADFDGPAAARELYEQETRARWADEDACRLNGGEPHRKTRRTAMPPRDGAEQADFGWAAAPELSVLRLNRRPPPTLPLEVFGQAWASWIETTASAAACPVD